MTTDMERQELESTLAEREKWGKRLLIAAWISVIIAAIIGLVIAWSVAYTAYLFEENESIQFVNVFFATLPFVIVSTVELLKIPLVYKIYNSKRVILKSIFAVVLILVTLVTFETVMLGFERQYANMTTEVDIPRNRLAVVDNEIQLISKEGVKNNLNLEKLLAEKIKLKTDIDRAAPNSQIYRIAMSWYEKGRASDLTESEVANIARVWFGILGFIVSTMGIFLAFGGIRLLRNKE
jgi:hypothetical protein